jgi:hypothetical protein
MISYGDKMPCHITDGPDTPEDMPSDAPECDLTDDWRQQEVDAEARRKALREALRDIGGRQGA